MWFKGLVGGLLGSITSTITGALRGFAEGSLGIPIRVMKASINSNDFDGGVIFSLLYIFSGACLLGGIVGAGVGGLAGLVRGATDGYTICSKEGSSILGYLGDRSAENLFSSGPFSSIKPEQVDDSQRERRFNDLQHEEEDEELEEEDEELEEEDEELEEEEQAPLNAGDEARLEAEERLKAEARLKAAERAQPLPIKTEPSLAAPPLGRKDSNIPQPTVFDVPASNDLTKVLRQYCAFREENSYDEPDSVQVPPAVVSSDKKSATIHFKSKTDAVKFSHDLAKSGAIFVIRDQMNNILAYSNNNKLYNPNTLKPYEVGEKLSPVSLENTEKALKEIESISAAKASPHKEDSPLAQNEEEEIQVNALP